MQTPSPSFATEADPYLLLIVSLYIAVSEAGGRRFEADTNRLLRRMQQHLPPDAAELCDYLLCFASRDKESKAVLALN